ncbi:MAG: 23S rRNA (pseudouridine(1915)-N(3))-methyltransferase RlmH [Candidatus Latescibacteria bacterium]|nr:23S rRNA (pseudouridine(1915)-N(3))-methyltransferase RlmH [Candidatus Latescibacterota bacterium]
MIRILAVGKLKDARLAGLAADFAQRIRPWSDLEIVELKDQGPEREAAAMLARLGPPSGHGLTIALDERGATATSHELSALLGAHGSLTFLIGGPDGLGPAARARADRILSLSPLTFTHETARFLLLEQIYRGLAILRGHPYHRD